MDEKPQYYERLLTSNAVRSLALEQAIHRVVMTYESADLRYPFYFSDPSEGKTRELDLYAEFHFDSGIQEGQASIEFLIECKDLTGAHLVFSRVTPRWPHSEVAGDHTFSERRHDFQEELLKDFDALETGYHIDTARQRLRKITDDRKFVKQANAKSLNFLPLTAECTAFRETTIKSEREPESSVLWKSLLSLRDGKRVIDQKRKNDAKRDILPQLRNDGFFDQMVERYSQSVGNIALTYPIIVVGARLHVLEEGQLRTADHVRLRIDVLGQSEFWVDVIHHSSFEERFREIFDHYWMEYPTELYCEVEFPASRT